MPEFHAEPYLVLADVRHDAALISWGAFYFRVRGRADGQGWKLVDDSDLDHVHPPRSDSIGSRSQSYGAARVEVMDATGALVAFAETKTTNHAWVAGLQPDTEYRYRVVVAGEEWAGGPRRDWHVEGERRGLIESGRVYDNRFRTHPHRSQPGLPLALAVIGDFGTGVRHPSSATRRQREVAAALERTVDARGVRVLLTTGDNIYAGKRFLGLPVGATGDEDDDWFFTYYQPYRYVLNRVPVYPAVGNHDSSETEASDDRQQLLDNFLLAERFQGEEQKGRASIGPGLFYRVTFGADVELVCVDTSRQSLLFGKRFYEHPNHHAFIESSFPDVASTPGPHPKWRIPFCHHPPYCAGPMHGNTDSMIEVLVPRFERSGVRLVLSGHEHNFQCSRAGDLWYFVTGAAGKLREGRPTKLEGSHHVAWAATCHFLLVELTEKSATVTPIDETGAALSLVDHRDHPVSTPFVIPAR